MNQSAGNAFTLGPKGRLPSAQPNGLGSRHASFRVLKGRADSWHMAERHAEDYRGPSGRMNRFGANPARWAGLRKNGPLGLQDRSGKKQPEGLPESSRRSQQRGDLRWTSPE